MMRAETEGMKEMGKEERDGRGGPGPLESLARH